MPFYKHLLPVVPSTVLGVVIWTLLGLGVGFNIGLYAANALDTPLHDVPKTLREQGALSLRPSAP